MKKLKVFTFLFFILYSFSLFGMQDSLLPDDFDEEVVDVDSEFIEPDVEVEDQDDVDIVQGDSILPNDFDEDVIDIDSEFLDQDDNILDEEVADLPMDDQDLPEQDSEIVLSEVEVKDGSVDSQDYENKKVDIENIDLPEEKIGIQGNWVKKREWVKESYKVNQQIQDAVSSIQKLKDPFQDKFIKIDNELDLFYKDEGLKQGSAKILFNSINRYLDKKKKEYSMRLKEGVTSYEEIELETLLRDTKILKKELKQLMLDVKSVDQIDKSLNERLKKLDEYLKMALDESVKTKDMTDEIWYVIDDLKARDIYYKLKGDSLEKVNAIKKYLTGSFQSDFDNLLSTIRDQFTKISEHIKDLEKRGLIIKDRSERLDEIRQKKEQERNNQTSNKEQDEQDLTITQKIYRYFVNKIAKIHNFLSSM